MSLLSRIFSRLQIKDSIVGLIICMFLLISVSSLAQVTAYVGGGSGLSEGLGYKNPNWTSTAGIELNPRRFLALAEVSAATANKIETNNGFSIKGVARGYIEHGRWLAGGGFSNSHTFTSKWDKGAMHGQVGIGYWRLNPNLRIFTDYILPRGDSQNDVHGVDFRYEIITRSHIEFRGEWQFLRYHPTGQKIVSSWGDSATFSVFYRLRFPRE